MAAWWLDHHHHNNKSANYNIVPPSVYDQLEEYWEDVADELAAQQSRISTRGSGVHGSAMEEEEGGGGCRDIDIGGELYRKSRESAMRRKLLFDCVNEVLGRMVRALVKKAVAMEPYDYCSNRSRNNGYSYQDDVVSVWRVIEEKSLVPVQQHFVLPNVPLFFIPLPIFYSPRREVVILRYIMFILYPFGQRYTSIFSLMNACYLGFHLSRLVPIYVLYNKTCAHV